MWVLGLLNAWHQISYWWRIKQNQHEPSWHSISGGCNPARGEPAAWNHHTQGIEKPISKYQVTRKSPNASCQVSSVAKLEMCDVPSMYGPSSFLWSLWLCSYMFLWFEIDWANITQALVELQLLDAQSSFPRCKWATSSPARLMPRTWSSSALGIKSSCTLGDKSIFKLGRLYRVWRPEQRTAIQSQALFIFDPPLFALAKATAAIRVCICISSCSRMVLLLTRCLVRYVSKSRSTKCLPGINLHWRKNLGGQSLALSFMTHNCKNLYA